MYRCGSCGKTFQKRSKKCPGCKSEGITLVPDKRGGSMGALVGLVLAAGAAAVVLAYLGFINIPGITPTTGKPSVQQLKPSPEAEKVEAKPSPTSDGTTPRSDAKKIEPRSPESVARPREIKPPVKPSDVESARALYAKGDFAGAARALDGCVDSEESDATTQARTLFRKARILDVVTKKIQQSPLATAKKLEQVAIQSGGTLLGLVTESGETLTVLMPGGITTEVSKDKVEERTPVERSVLVEKLRKRLKDKEERLKADDSFGQFRLGHYCWQYALLDDSVPYFDKSVEGDDFPVVARVFGGSDSAKLVTLWSELTGKTPPGAPARPVASSKTPGSERVSTAPEPSPAPPSGNVADIATRARAKYEEGLAKYRLSYGDTKEAHAAHVAAFKLLQEARDILNAAGEDPFVDELRTDISRVLMDCRKRPM